jgi:hypothetical protein
MMHDNILNVDSWKLIQKVKNYQPGGGRTMDYQEDEERIVCETEWASESLLWSSWWWWWLLTTEDSWVRLQIPPSHLSASRTNTNILSQIQRRSTPSGHNGSALRNHSTGGVPEVWPSQNDPVPVRYEVRWHPAWVCTRWIKEITLPLTQNRTRLLSSARPEHTSLAVNGQTNMVLQG